MLRRTGGRLQLPGRRRRGNACRVSAWSSRSLDTTPGCGPSQLAHAGLPDLTLFLWRADHCAAWAGLVLPLPFLRTEMPSIPQ